MVNQRPKWPDRPRPRNRAIVGPQGVWLHTEYEEGFVETLKDAFPWHARYWVPEKTAWRVEGPENIRSALGIFKTFFPEGTVIDD
jgi:hypothetical protein